MYLVSALPPLPLTLERLYSCLQHKIVSRDLQSSWLRAIIVVEDEVPLPQEPFEIDLRELLVYVLAPPPPKDAALRLLSVHGHSLL